jgi:hypothetical protein
MLIVCCPICGVGAEKILDEYRVTVRSPSESTLGGLCAYLCAGGHVFFVREADLDLAKATAA